MAGNRVVLRLRGEGRTVVVLRTFVQFSILDLGHKVDFSRVSGSACVPALQGAIC